MSVATSSSVQTNFSCSRSCFHSWSCIKAEKQSHTGAQTAYVSQLTDTPQALLVKSPDEVSTQVTPCGLSVAAGLEVMSLSLLLCELGVEGAAQDPDDAHPAQQIRDLPRADPQGVGSLQARRWTWRVRASQLYRLSDGPQVTELDELPQRHCITQTLCSSSITYRQKNRLNRQKDTAKYTICLLFSQFKNGTSKW